MTLRAASSIETTRPVDATRLELIIARYTAKKIPGKMDCQKSKDDNGNEDDGDGDDEE